MKLKNPFLILISVVLLVGCSGTSQHGRTSSGVDLSILCSRHNVQWKWDSISQIVTLSGNLKKARVLVGSDVVMVGPERVVLSAPVIRVQNSVLVPPDFERRVMQNLTSGKMAMAHRFRKIVIDPGHGGRDPGAVSPDGSYEKDVVLDISKRLKRKLESRGLEVVMTRTGDKFLELGERTEIALKEKADLFISVHANANNSRSVHGLEVYYFGDLLPKDEKEDQRLRNEWILFSTLEMRKTDEVKTIVREVLDDYKQSVSKPLAAHVSKEMTREVGAKNNGHIEARFHVLRNNFIPSILVEVGYLTHPKEERLLKSPDYREKVARALADSILSYE